MGDSPSLADVREDGQVDVTTAPEAEWWTTSDAMEEE